MSYAGVSRLDIMYRRILLNKFFTKGWGAPENLMDLFNFRQVMSNRDTCYNLVPKDYRIEILSEESLSDCRILDGRFISPFYLHQPKLLVSEIKDAYFQMVLPLEWPDRHKPVVIQLAGTGDHYFWRRRNLMAKPLLQNGIGSIILENPFYGVRKPKEQVRSSLHHVSDIFVMGGCLILECIALLKWCESTGFGPLGVTGISMGGHMASLAASNWPKPLVLVPCLSWSTASSVFTEGVMCESIDWDMLQKQLLSNQLYCDTLSKACKIVDSPFACPLSRIPEFGLHPFLDDYAGIRNISPFDIISAVDNLNCPAITYKVGNVEFKLVPDEPSQSLGVVGLSSKKLTKMRKRSKEAIWFMRGIMDEFTHLSNFPVPVDTSLIIAVCATIDGYVPRKGISNLEDLWPGVTIRYVDTGHVGAYIWYRKLFRSCIVEAFERAKKIIPPPHTDIIEW